MSSHHITEFYAENIKRLRVVRITPAGAVVQVTGANGSGKSSVLDAIWWALAGKGEIDPEPIRRGEESAIVRLTLGDVIITRTFSPGENGKTESELRVEASSGARFPSPQKMLDDLLGKSALSFDPLAFDRMKPPEQLEELRKIAPLPDVVVKWESEIESVFEKRKEQNRRVRDLEGRARSTGVQLPEGYDPTAKTYQPEDTSTLLEQLSRIGETSTAIAGERARRERRRGEAFDQRAAAKMRREQAERLLAEAEVCERLAGEIEAEVEKLPALQPLPDGTAMREALDRATATNEKLARMRAQWDLEAELKAARDLADGMTRTIEQGERFIAEATAKAEMPVPGLAYGKQGITFRGLPLEQASSAERLRVSLAMAMAANPKLRVIRIKDGSLLDEQSLALVAEAAGEKDYQVWIERVDTSGKVGVVMSGGEVASVDGVPVPDPDPEHANTATAEGAEQRIESAPRRRRKDQS